MKLSVVLLVVKHEIVHELVGGDSKHNSPLFGICSGRAY